ncbi:MAG: helix-turn-helix domain-containing protein [Pseudonocardiaceae bacterium]
MAVGCAAGSSGGASAPWLPVKEGTAVGEQRPNAQRLQLAARLRRLREAAGQLQEHSAATLGCDTSKISRIEHGHSGLKAAELEKLLDLYQVTGPERQELLEVGKEARQRGRRKLYGDTLPGYFRRFIDLEVDATEIRCYEGELVPGLLQTEDYARALIRVALLGAEQTEVDRRVKIRMDRHAILTRKAPPPPRLWCVLGEAVFARPVGGPEVMRAQMEHLLQITTEPTTVTVQVLPFSVGEYPGLGGSFSLLSLDSAAPTIGHMDTLGIGSTYVEREDVASLIERFDRLRAKSLEPEKSREFILNRIAQQR